MTIPMPMLGSGPYGTSPRSHHVTRNVDAKEVAAFFKDINESQEHVSADTASHLGWKEKISRQYKKLHLRRDKTMQEVMLGEGPSM